MTDVRYLYLLRGTLKTHVHFSKCWVDLVRAAGVDMHMVVAMRPDRALQEADLIKDFESDYCHVLVDRNPRKATKAYLAAACRTSSRVIVHLKKVGLSTVARLQRDYPDTLRVLIELEGDLPSELEFHLDHPRKWGYFSFRRWREGALRTVARYILQRLGVMVRHQRKLVDCADHVFVVTEEFKALLVRRFKRLDLESKVSVLPVSFSEGRLMYSSELRESYRAQMGVGTRFTLAYVGSALDTWQNLYRALEIFVLIRQKVISDAFFFMAVREADHDIARGFIDRVGLDPMNYMLTSVPHEEIPGYLCASDLGVVLRHPHAMNRVCTSGKVVDYLGCGLPVLMTDAVSYFPEIVRERGWGAVLENMDDDDEIVSVLAPYTIHNAEQRTYISEWMNTNYSTRCFQKKYLSALDRMCVPKSIEEATAAL
ncbi:MAG: glycosyltransferase involved in cell wall biosynthesis [Kiritimatiellia bacterium]|jgi:glycosyltransferase involved in cell wall biosynthesis